ncbi:P-loop containing nucleoside triphosphate hydrolase protein [Artomyces pyxidatus]|uniref:P-loop containing nucleoside triphosphate hydrolase protein n=1 Tax=Artomyces pyxidatus TaxID=48021 RepID=A0ACB8SYT9_9AGAM|nr:P-loop containing nucleoside triphosphate hydrolase protein [Artomyces pyxidatus]
MPVNIKTANELDQVCVLERLDPSSLMLNSDTAIETAVSFVEGIMLSKSMAPPLEALFRRPLCLEFFLSAMSDDAFAVAERWILSQFPVQLDAYSSDSLCFRMLARFAVSFQFLLYRSETIPPAFLHMWHRDVTETIPILDALFLMQQNEYPATPATDNAEEEHGGFVKKKQSQRARKHQRKASRAKKPVDLAPFRAAGVAIPTTRDELVDIAESYLLRQKDILDAMLGTFRRADFRPVIKAAYIPSAVAEAHVEDTYAQIDAPVIIEALVSESVPAAYPLVLPMKAALYFESADGFGEWRILISGRADRNLREAKKKDANTFRIILKKIKELSNGHFSDDNQKRLTGPGTVVPIFEAKMTRDLRLVYQVDCAPEFDSKVERQVIKVFGIYTHAQLDKRLWESIGHQLSSKGKEYAKRCTFRCEPFHKGDSVVPPASFPPAPVTETKATASELPEARKEDQGEVHSLLVLEKFVIFSQALLTSILADQDVAHVFQVSPHEQEIIEHPFSCYVLGRSGTGKTTTMLFKMLGMENSWQQNRELRPTRPRQLFVTQSRVLADKVEEYFLKLLQSLSIAAHTESGISELLERQKNREEGGLVDRDEAVDWRDDLPRRFSELKDSHFPMFITFDKLSSLLEADMDQASGKLVSSEERQDWNSGGLVLPGQPTQPSEYMLQKRVSFVSYDVFREDYWPHFPQPLTKGLDKSLVFSEFMGVIKGSEQTLSSEEPYLDYKTYLDLSTRAQSTFASKRLEIYNLFQAYLKMKRERRDYDAADRTHAILRELRHGVQGKKLDFLYVDEVQDNLLIDAKLLRSICHNPDGLFWAGDTAQTISVGSSFRFDDLKAFLHRVEEDTHDPAIQSKAAQAPKSFHLSTNFRSHAGIVKCAHSVIELITKFWPYAIDILAEEKGVVDGIKPVFFSGWDQDNVRYESFLFGAAGQHIEFGAQQCILVRNDVAREKLRKQVGDVGLIMTLYESKGLEFNDVLLYNFFEDSAVEVSQWRVVLNALERSQRAKIAAPTFDENRHAGVCSELKFLYVALTRARQNLWLVDRSEKGEPMRMFWSARGLVENYTPSSADIPQLAVSSTPEEWEKMARTLFDNKRYFQAMHSYDRAGKSREKAIARAYHLREVARSVPSSATRANNVARKDAFLAVAEAFIHSANEAVIVRERTEYFRIAAEAYVALEDFAKAAEAYANASMFTQAAQYYRKAGLFDDTVAIIKGHRSEVDADVADHLYNIAKLFYLRRGDLRRASGLFSSLEEKLEFVLDHDLDIAHAEILTDEGRFAEAADLHMQEGRTLDALRLYLRDRSSQKSLDKAKDCLLEALWGAFSMGVSRDPGDVTPAKSVQELFELVEKLDDATFSPRDRREIQMFIALEKSDATQLRTLGESMFIQDGNKPAALICLDRVFADVKGFLQGSGEIGTKLRAFHSYALLYKEVMFHPTPWSSRALTRLFSLKMDLEGRVLLSPGTLLHRLYEKYKARASVPGEITLDQPTFLQFFRFSLGDRLRERITDQSDRCLLMRELEPCSNLALRGQCDFKDCPRQHTLDPACYNRRLHFHLQQVLILQVYQSLDNSSARLQRIWFERLYESLNPGHHAFGSMACIGNPLPEVTRAIGVLKEWIRSTLYKLDPYRPQSAFVTNLLRYLDVGISFDAAAVDDYITRTQIVRLYRPPHLCRSSDKYVVDDVVCFFKMSEACSVDAGALFLRHIIQSHLPVDIGALCRFLDILCGSYIFAQKLRQWSGAPPLHNTTMPRSWILEHLPHTTKLKGKDTRAFLAIANPVADLLQQLYSGKDAEHLSYQNRPIEQATLQVKNMFIARICRALCLVGYNMGSRMLQDDIYHAVTALRRIDPNRVFPPLYQQ